MAKLKWLARQIKTENERFSELQGKDRWLTEHDGKPVKLPKKKLVRPSESYQRLRRK